MENRNIYKMDDFLIIISYLMIIPLLIIAWPWLRTITRFSGLNEFFQAAPILLGPRLSGIIIYGTGAISSQIAGRIIRFKEKQSLEILDTLNFSKKSTISQLSTQLNMSESKITSLVKKMSRISSLGISIDGEMVTIGQKTEKAAPDNYSTITQGLEQKAPPPIDEKLEEILKNGDPKSPEFKKAAQSFLDARQNQGEKGKKFNVVLFIILFITPLWPIALVYAISFAVKQQKGLTNKEK